MLPYPPSIVDHSMMEEENRVTLPKVVQNIYDSCMETNVLHVSVIIFTLYIDE